MFRAQQDTKSVMDAPVVAVELSVLRPSFGGLGTELALLPTLSPVCFTLTWSVQLPFAADHMRILRCPI